MYKKGFEYKGQNKYNKYNEQQTGTEEERGPCPQGLNICKVEGTKAPYRSPGTARIYVCTLYPGAKKFSPAPSRGCGITLSAMMLVST